MSEPTLAARAHELRALHSDSLAHLGREEPGYADQIKTLVEERLRESNRDANIERTLYFNHSAIPDFVITWGRSKYPRGVYLRGSYAAIVATNDVQTNRHDDPIFMSLNDEQNFELGGIDFSRERIAQVVAESTATLVTDINAFSTATEPLERNDNSPLQDLVRSNFVRGGRGLFDGQQVRQLVHELDRPDGNSVLSEIGSHFTAQAQGEFHRAATLIDLARSSDPHEMLDRAHLLRGRLTYQEVRSLLPWLTSHSSAPTGSPFWRLLGSMIDLELLEHEAAALRDVDLTALVESNLDTLAASRAYAGLNVEHATDDNSPQRATWRMVGATLTRLEGSSAIRFAHLGTRLRTSGSFNAPRWSSISDRLSAYALAGAGVSGIDETIRVDSRRGRSIREYLNYAIPAPSKDEYFVDDVTVRLENAGLEGEDREITVDFTSRLILPNAATSIRPMLELVNLLEELNPQHDETASNV